MSASDGVLENHFWWRPGWRPGRAYLTWHVLPDPGVATALAPVASSLAGVDHLAAVRPERLHVTGPGVGFLDEVEHRVDAIVGAARQHLARTPRFEAVLGEPEIGRDGVAVPVQAESMTLLRHGLRDSMRSAGHVPPGADDEPYSPHLTLAYATGPADRHEIASALSRTSSTAGRTLHVTAATLLALRMEPPGYEWTEVARVGLS